MIKLDKEAPYIISNYRGAQLIATSINGIVLIDLLQRPEAIATTPKKVTRVRSRDDSHKRAGVQFWFIGRGLSNWQDVIARSATWRGSVGESTFAHNGRCSEISVCKLVIFSDCVVFCIVLRL